jgi:ferric-dicitrate binding protein FerR (iron transport regulator)
MKRRLFGRLVLLAVGLVPPAQAARAQDYSKIRIVRLSFVEGAVQYRRLGEDWQDASLNLPIQEGFTLRTAGGHAEVEFENSLTMRLGTNATVDVAVLALQGGGRITQLAVSQGVILVNAKLRREDTMSVVAAHLTMKVPRNGRFRVDESPSEIWVTALRGSVEVDFDSGAASLVSGGHTLHENVNGSGSPEITSTPPPQDDLDKWVSDRGGPLTSRPCLTGTRC